jgi:hypothetical protein
VLRKFIVYYTRKHKKCKKIKNDYELKLLSFLKTIKHWIYKESKHFQIFIFTQKWWRKKCHVFGKL